MPGCPSCAEELSLPAERCPHCGERLTRTSTSVLSPEDLAWEREQGRVAARRRARKLLIIFGGLASILLGAGGLCLVQDGLLRGDRVVGLSGWPRNAHLGVVIRGLPGGGQGAFLDTGCEFSFLWDDYHDEPRRVATIVDDAKDPNDDPSAEQVAGLECVRLEWKGETLARIYAPPSPGLGPPTYLGFVPSPAPGAPLGGRTLIRSAAEKAWGASTVAGTVPSALCVLAGLFAAALAVYVPLVVLVVDRGLPQSARDLRGWLGARGPFQRG